jgi:hypothetical protein
MRLKIGLKMKMALAECRSEDAGKAEMNAPTV